MGIVSEIIDTRLTPSVHANALRMKKVMAKKRKTVIKAAPKT